MAEKKVRQHKVLSHPILSCLLLMVYGYVFYQTIGGVGYVLFNNNYVALYLFSALVGALLLIIHRL